MNRAMLNLLKNAKPLLMFPEKAARTARGEQTMFVLPAEKQPDDAYCDWQRTQTHKFKEVSNGIFDCSCRCGKNNHGSPIFVSQYKKGDYLYVKESFAETNHGDIVYRATYSGTEKHSWKQPVAMSKSKSRLLLKVVNVQLKAFNELSFDDIHKVGFTSIEELKEEYDTKYKLLWFNTDGSRFNPYIWIVEYEVVSDSLAIQIAS